MSWVSPQYGTRYRTWVRGGHEYTGVVAGQPSFVVSGKNVTNPINSMFKSNLIAPYNDLPFGSMHSGGCNFALGDGSVRFVRETLDIATYRALASRDRGEVIARSAELVRFRRAWLEAALPEVGLSCLAQRQHAADNH